MLNSQTVHLLAEFLDAFAASEFEIESKRLQLAQIDEFDPHSCFQNIDRMTSGYATSSDLVNFLQSYHIRCSESQISSFIEIFDSGANGKLTYPDFLEAVLPSTNLILRQVATRRHTYIEIIGKKSRLNDVDQLLAHLLQVEISYYDRINIMRQSLTKEPDWDLHHVFCNISTERTPSIDQKSLVEFLKKNTNLTSSSDKLTPFFKRFDHDKDGKLSFVEFQRIFLPSSPKKKQQANNSYGVLTESLVDVSNRQSRPPTQTESEKKEFVYIPQGFLPESTSNGDHEVFHKRSNQSQDSSQKKLVGSERLLTPIEHLHKLVEDALTRSQAMRARSVSKSRDMPLRENKSVESEQKRSIPAIPRSSPKKKVEFEDKFAAWNKSSTNIDSKTWQNKSFEMPISRDLTIETSGYLSNSSQSYKIAAGFRTNPESLSKNSMLHSHNALSSDYSVNNHNNSRPHQDNSFHQDYDQLQELPVTSKSDAAPFIDESERRKILNSVVSKYANLPRAERKRTPQVSDTQKNPIKIQLKRMFNAPRQNTKTETQIEEINNSVSLNLTAFSEITGDFRTPGRPKLLRDQDENSQLTAFSPEKTKGYKSNDIEYLIIALREIADLDSQVDSVRQILAYHSDFTIPAAYRFLFDKSGTDACDMTKFIGILNQRGIKLEKPDIQLVFAQFDRDADGKFGQKDFEHLIIPRDPSSAEVLEGRRKSDYIYKYDTQNLLNRFVEMAVGLVLNIENIKQKLQQRPGFKLEATISSIDAAGRGFISAESLKELLEKNAVSLREKDFRILVKRYDANNDGKVILSKLTDELTPKKSYLNSQPIS